MTENTKPDGGPAFPTIETDDHRIHTMPGMTLRDHFAGLALAAMIGNTDKDGCTRGAAGVPILTGYAYEYADAMIAARGAA